MKIMKNLIGALGGGAAIFATSAFGDEGTSAYDFSFTAIDGGEVRLADYAGSVILVVNTASRCGYTRQYDGLQEIWTTLRDDGLVVLGVPSNAFRQELADNAAVKAFCEMRFDLDFPLTGITPVTGEDSHPFYAWVRETTGQSAFPGWNFNKVVIGRDGGVRATFGSRASPTGGKLRDAITTALADAPSA